MTAVVAINKLSHENNISIPLPFSFIVWHFQGRWLVSLVDVSTHSHFIKLSDNAIESP